MSRMKSLYKDEKDWARVRWGRNKHVGVCVQSEFFQQVPFFFNREGMNLHLLGMYRGASCFLVCGGPSLKEIDLIRLQNPGILTMSINNAISMVRTNLWCSVDEPTHFLATTWLDPKITKYVPVCHFEKPLWDTRDGGWKPLKIGGKQIVVGDCPNVVGYRRNEKFNPERFLYEDTINWGNHKKYGGARSVMLAALRILFLLGIRKVYLCGVDFNMPKDKPYAFDETKNEGGVKDNNDKFKILMDQLQLLKPYFEEVRFSILNCNPNSGLRVFDFIDFEQAVSNEMTLIGDPSKESTKGMYESTYEEKQIKFVQEQTGIKTVLPTIVLTLKPDNETKDSSDEG